MKKLNEVEIFLIVLQILFLILRLTDLIDWSWWWVFAPALIVFSTMMLLIVLTVLGMIYRRFFRK